MTIKQTPTTYKKQLTIPNKDEPLIRTVSTGHLLKDIVKDKLKIHHSEKSKKPLKISEKK